MPLAPLAPRLSTHYKRSQIPNMPIALLIIGLVMVIAAVRGTQGTLAGLLKGDFTGTSNFLYWLVAILAIGSIGYVKRLKTFSDTFLGLILIAMLLANKGFFAQFTQAIGLKTSTTTSALQEVANT